MLLFYVDEVGNERLDKKSMNAHPWFVLGAMAVKETSRQSLKVHIENIKDSFLPGWRTETWSDNEIKGRYVAKATRQIERASPPPEPPGYLKLCRYRGAGAARKLDVGATQRRLREFVDAIFNTLHKFRPVFYFVAVDKQTLHSEYGARAWSPIAVAYAYLQMRAALLVELVYGGDEGAVFLADEQGTHESLFRKGQVKTLRDDLIQRVAYPPKMELIIDKPIWINRGELVADREIGQILDVVLYTIGAAARNKWVSNPWLRELFPYLAKHWTTGEVWDAGLTIFPSYPPYPAIP